VYLLLLDVLQLVAGIVVVTFCVRDARPVKDRDAPFKWTLKDPRLLFMAVLCPLLFPLINEFGSFVQTHLVRADAPHASTRCITSVGCIDASCSPPESTPSAPHCL
jgi:hypothetical protein